MQVHIAMSSRQANQTYKTRKLLCFERSPSMRGGGSLLLLLLLLLLIYMRACLLLLHDIMIGD